MVSCLCLCVGVYNSGPDEPSCGYRGLLYHLCKLLSKAQKMFAPLMRFIHHLNVSVQLQVLGKVFFLFFLRVTVISCKVNSSLHIFRNTLIRAEVLMTIK